MNDDLHSPTTGVYRGVPMARHLPCEESTAPLSEFLAIECGNSDWSAVRIELLILRFLVDNKMRIVGE